MSTRTQHLPPRSEYRFELEPSERLAIRLIPNSGDAEVFGAELVAGQERWYFFGDEAKGAVSSWNGCDLEASTEYLADEPSPIYTSYANLHLHLEARRLKARDALRSDASLLASHSDSSSYLAEAQGPRIMIVGPESSGKSSLVKFLANYALRSPAVCDPQRAQGKGKEKEKGNAAGEKDGSDITGWWPLVVNLDAGVGAIPLPCTYSLQPLCPLPTTSLPTVSSTLPLGLTTPITGTLPPLAASAMQTSPLTLWLGRETHRDNELHARRVVEWLAMGLERRLNRDARARASGIIVDTEGVNTGDGRSRYSFLQHCARTLNVDTIVVLGHEKLTIELSRALGGSGITVLKLPKSGGVVELDDTYKNRLRSAQIKSYFYGGGGSGSSGATNGGSEDPTQQQDGASGQNKDFPPGALEPLGALPSLNPYSQTIPLDLLEVYRVGQESMAPSSALPIGADRTVTETQLHKLSQASSTLDQSGLLHSVLALLQPPRGGGGKGKPDSAVEPMPTDDELIGATVLGFAHVAAIDATRKRMTVLSPSQGRLPSKTALVGTLDWQDA